MYYLVIRFAEVNQSNCQYSFNFEKHTCLRTGEVEDLPRPPPLAADGDAPVADECVPLQLHAVLQHPRAELGGGFLTLELKTDSTMQSLSRAALKNYILTKLPDCEIYRRFVASSTRHAPPSCGVKQERLARGHVWSHVTIVDMESDVECTWLFSASTRQMNKSYCFILLSTFGGAPRLAVSVVVSNPCAGVVGFIE